MEHRSTTELRQLAIPRFAFRLTGPGTAAWLLVGMIAVLTLYPVIMVLLHSVRLEAPGQPATWGLDGWRAFGRPSVLGAAFTTLTLVVTQQAIAMALGIGVAWLLARTDLPGRSVFEVLFWIPFFLPALPVTLGWILLLHPQFGLANQLLMKTFGLAQPPFNIFSFWGIIWVHLSLYTVSIKVMLLTPAFRNLDASLEEAAITSGCTPWQALRRVTVPLLMPTLLTVLTLSIIRNLEAFEVELMLGLPAKIYVYSTLIYDLVRWTPPDYPPAMALGTVFMVILAALVLCQTLYLGRKQYRTVTGKGFSARRTPLGFWKWPCFALMTILSVVLTVVPIVFLTVASFMRLFGFFDGPDVWTLRNWQSVWADPVFMSSLRNTVMLGLGTVVCAVVISMLVAYIVARTNFGGRRLLDSLIWVPWGLPGILLGLGLLWMFLGNPLLAPLFGTLGLLVLALAIRELPMASQMFKSAISQVDKELEEAAYISGAPWFYTFRRVLLPVVIQTVFAVALVVFITSARDTSTVVLLSSADSRPLSVLMLDYLLESKEYERAAVVGSVLALGVVSVALLARYAGYRIGIRG